MKSLIKYLVLISFIAMPLHAEATLEKEQSLQDLLMEDIQNAAQHIRELSAQTWDSAKEIAKYPIVKGLSISALVGAIAITSLYKLSKYNNSAAVIIHNFPYHFKQLYYKLLREPYNVVRFQSGKIVDVASRAKVKSQLSWYLSTWAWWYKKRGVPFRINVRLNPDGFWEVTNVTKKPTSQMQ